MDYCLHHLGTFKLYDIFMTFLGYNEQFAFKITSLTSKKKSMPSESIRKFLPEPLHLHQDYEVSLLRQILFTSRLVGS